MFNFINDFNAQTKYEFNVIGLYSTNVKDIVGMDAFGIDTMALTMYHDVVWELWCEMDFTSYPLDKQVSGVLIILSSISQC